MELHLKIIGALLLPLALVHVVFPARFNWKEDLSGISLINRQLMYVHTFFIGFVVFLIGLLCLTCSEELVNTPLGKKICFGLFVFWGTRLYFQFFVYSPKLWRGKRFETVMHVLFSVLWVYLTGVFGMVWWG